MNEKSPVTKSEHLRPDVPTLDPGDSVQRAAAAMAEFDTDAMVVVSALGLHGMLTDRDILIRVVAAGLDPATTRVRDVMSSTLVTCPADAAVEDIIADMSARQIRRMPVVNADGQMIGLLSVEKVALSAVTPRPPEPAKA